MNRAEIFGHLACARNLVRGRFGPIRNDPLGLLPGLVWREHLWAGVDRSRDGDLAHIASLAEKLPFPFWNGIHPAFFDERIKEKYGPINLDKVLPSGKPMVAIMEPLGAEGKRLAKQQVDFMYEQSPAGSVGAIFFTKGKTSLYRRVPIANAFAGDAHQMSIPIFAYKLRGINLFLLTNSKSISHPQLWDSPFPGRNGEEGYFYWSNMHQVAHGMVIPTCWEYLDKSYHLLSWKELVELSKERLSLLNRWSHEYWFSGTADSTTYLYEIKVIERARDLARVMRLPDENNLDSCSGWYRGLHFSEQIEQISADPKRVIAGLNAMNRYIESAHFSPTQNHFLLSAVFSTDIGTHPMEEIIVDMLANYLAGTLEDKYSYWKNYLEKMRGYWQRWEGYHARLIGSLHSEQD